MDWRSSLVRHAIAPLWAGWEKSPYLGHYRLLRRAQYDSPDAIRARQWHVLTGLLRHAYTTTRFWRERLDRAGVRPQEVRSWEEFRAVPVLTKEDLRDHGADLLSSVYCCSGLHHKRTSGSTGVPVDVFVDEAAQQWKRACTLRSDEWSGWRLGEPVAKVWGNPEYVKNGWRGRLRNRLLDRARYLDTLKMDTAAMTDFLDSLHRQPPSLLFGHAHSLYLFAAFVRSRGRAGFRPRGILATAMVLHAWERHAIEEVFDCPVTNRYGCEEVSLIACECERHQGLHVNADGVYVEVLRPDGSAAEPGEAGAVVVTDLVNRAMPLLRYRVGDMAVSTDRQCLCGRGLPLLERLEGRVADYVVTPGGELVSGISLTENFALHVPGINQLQIVQETIEHFRFRIVRGPNFGPASLRRVGELVAERFGPRVTHTCEFVERIPQEPSGKYRFCISRVANPFSRAAETAVP